MEATESESMRDMLNMELATAKASIVAVVVKLIKELEVDKDWSALGATRSWASATRGRRSRLELAFRKWVQLKFEAEAGCAGRAAS